MLVPVLALSLAAARPDLSTTAEKTGFARTGRYDEAVRLCHDLERVHPRTARCFTYGTTPEGRDLVALAVSADGVVRPLQARAKDRPVILLQGGIHAGEIDGKDAGFMLLRDLLATAGGGPLAKVTAVFVPVVNPDGHERFGPNQRPNQRGPAETGWRTTAQNLNMNRDYAKADAPETRALLALLSEWDPIVYADLHVTDGARFEHDVAVLVEPKLGYDPSLRAEGAAMSDALLARLEQDGHLPLDFYPSFVRDGDPESGFQRRPPPPRFAHGYWAARNRFGILLETHSWRAYRERVKATVDFCRALLELGAERGAAWRAAAARADRAAPSLAGKEVALDSAPEGPPRTIRFRGYAWERADSPALGRPVVSYDEGRPAIWDVPLLERQRPSATAVLPRGGWIVPAAWAPRVADRLRLHGVLFSRLEGGRPGADVEVFRATEAKLAPASFEGRQTLTVKGAWAREKRDLAPGALFVPAAQARALLAAHLLEPAGPDSFLAWGDFNAAFEKKEYVEDYVLEPFARELLDKDPAVRAELERRIAEDPSFAKDPQARLEFFGARHPSSDDAYRLYPVVRADARP
ncbi:MAG TPA: M14 family metallopeptidase [Anaeromyxobacter sp.]|nr:M14 family metallopeptidase [Anaeromyxobacter sp.]